MNLKRHSSLALFMILFLASITPLMAQEYRLPYEILIWGAGGSTGGGQGGGCIQEGGSFDVVISNSTIRFENVQLNGECPSCMEFFPLYQGTISGDTFEGTSDNCPGSPDYFSGSFLANDIAFSGRYSTDCSLPLSCSFLVFARQIPQPIPTLNHLATIVFLALILAGGVFILRISRAR